jgi:hypothetical protein
MSIRLPIGQALVRSAREEYERTRRGQRHYLEAP